LPYAVFIRRLPELPVRPALPVALGLCAVTLVFAGLDAYAAPKHVKAAGARSSAAKSSKDADPDTIHVPTINDAPKGDFERVAWCHGILSGDMQLADIVNSLEPKDPQIEIIGRSYLRAYEAALTLSTQGKTAAGHALAEKARQKGFDEWAQARNSDIKKAAWVYDNWQLPGDCEHAAVRLSGHPNLFAEMATDEETRTINDVMNSSNGPHPYLEGAAPTLKAKTVDPNADLVANNTTAQQASASASSASENASAAKAYSQDLGQKLGWDKTSN
jgi:hypothetical protein